jgi:penicillin-binding protein 1C
MLKYSKSQVFGVSFWSVLFLLAIVLCIPTPNFKPAYSNQLYSAENVLLAATVSKEQQWCFPMDEDIPEALKAAIVTYEDEYFAYHPGLNPVSILKAAYTNVKSGKVKRGASTIPMQVMRMKNKNASRNWFNKIREAIASIKYSLLHSDDTILKEWCEMAPFGGNTIGVKAAALRYFNRPLDKLSWAEYSLLAVMPNGPSTANLTKNREKLLLKRNFLLKKLHKKGYIKDSDLELYLGEDIPVQAAEIPQNAYHLLLYLSKKYPEQKVFKSMVSQSLQLKTAELLQTETTFLQMDDINNMAAVVIDVTNNSLVAYHGNIKNKNGKFSYVDIAQAPRSYGSLLKPLLYAHVLESGLLLPQELVADIPTAIGDFQPENFDKKYRGAVPFTDILLKSLNVPAVRVLNTVGLQSYYEMVQKLDLAYLNRGQDHYGLSIILGGGESSLWDMCRLYKGFAQNYKGFTHPYEDVKVLADKPVSKTHSFHFSGYTIDHLVNTMADVTRPREEKSWDYYGTTNKVAWKTGTSFGHKDAWCIGFNGKYLVGIWIGNEGGEGRYDLTGISKAAPLMFKMFNALPDNVWFGSKPVYSRKEIIRTCRESGKLAGPLCKYVKDLNVEHSSMRFNPCTYHKIVLLDANGVQLSEKCKSLTQKQDTMFVLPSHMEYYYTASDLKYKVLPPYRPDCYDDDSALNIVYPSEGIRVFIPKTGEKTQNNIILKAYHRDKTTTLYWIINDKYIGATSKGKHEILFTGEKGYYQLSISDQNGNQDQISFEVI